jgi:hypothetical protein
MNHCKEEWAMNFMQWPYRPLYQSKESYYG